MPMLKQTKVKKITEKSVKHAFAGVGKYLSRGQWETANSRKLLRLSRYLAWGNGKQYERALCHSHSDNIMCDDERGWEREFIDTKRQWGKMKGVPYYHFVISPDPRDKVSPEECLQLAEEWLEENYEGAQWYACVHNDNQNEVMHAHIVINSVYPDTGMKINRSDNDIRNEAKSLQRIAYEKHGLTQLEDIDEYRKRKTSDDENERQRKEITRDHAEAGIVARGARSYKAEIRKAVDAVARSTYSWEDFEAKLDEDYDIEITYTRRGITYVLRDWCGKGARRMPSTRLGAAYTREGIFDRLGVDFDAALGMKVPSWGRPVSGPRRAFILRTAQIRVTRFRPQARHRSADGMIEYQTLSEFLGARVSMSPARRALDEVIRACDTLQSGGFRTARDLDERIDELTLQQAELDTRMEELRVAQDAAFDIFKMDDEIKGIDAELRKLEANGRFWRPSDRRRKVELEDRRECDMRKIGDLLSTGSMWAESRGIDVTDEDYLRVALAMADAVREELDTRGRAAVEDVNRELGDLLNARMVIASLRGPRRPTMRESAEAARAAALTRRRIRKGSPTKEGIVATEDKRHVAIADLGSPTRQGIELTVEQREGLDLARVEAAARDMQGQMAAQQRELTRLSDERLEDDARERRKSGDSWLRQRGIDPFAGEARQREEVPRGVSEGIRPAQKREKDK